MKSNRTMHPMGHEDEADVRRSEVQEAARCVASHTSHTPLTTSPRGACGWATRRLWCCRKYLLGKCFGGRHFSGAPGQTGPSNGGWRNPTTRA